jgi:hypothetical protein
MSSCRAWPAQAPRCLPTLAKERERERERERAQVQVQVQVLALVQALVLALVQALVLALAQPRPLAQVQLQLQAMRVRLVQLVQLWLRVPSKPRLGSQTAHQDRLWTVFQLLGSVAAVLGLLDWVSSGQIN